MNPVTDPATLAQLNAVDDPQVLAQLNAPGGGMPVPSFATANADTPAWMVPFIGAGRTVDQLIRGARSLVGAPEAPDPTADAAYATLQQQAPVETTVGESLPFMVSGNPLVMGGMSALMPGTPLERVENAAGGVLGGAIGKGLGGAIARLKGPASMGVADAAGAAAQASGNPYGIPLSVGQATGSRPAQIMESVLENLPFSSHTIGAARDATFSAFNRAIANTFGTDSASLTPEVLGAARERVGGTIGDIAARNQLTLDPTLAAKLATLSQQAPSQLAPDSAALFNKQLSSIVGGIDPETGTMPGTLYKAIDGQLGRLAKGTQDGNLAYQFGQLRSTLRDGMDRSISPEDAEAWQTARRQYANLMTVSNAMKNSPAGTTSPAQLLQAVNNAQPNARFGAGTDLAALAQWAKPTIGPSVPNSGTAQRLFYQRILENPLASMAGIGGGLYAAREEGLDPTDAAVPAGLAYGTARVLAGAPASPLARLLMTTFAGGLGANLGTRGAQSAGGAQ